MAVPLSDAIGVIDAADSSTVTVDGSNRVQSVDIQSADGGQWTTRTTSIISPPLYSTDGYINISRPTTETAEAVEWGVNPFGGSNGVVVMCINILPVSGIKGFWSLNTDVGGVPSPKMYAIVNNSANHVLGPMASSFPAVTAQPMVHAIIKTGNTYRWRRNGKEMISDSSTVDLSGMTYSAIGYGWTHGSSGQYTRGSTLHLWRHAAVSRELSLAEIQALEYWAWTGEVLQSSGSRRPLLSSPHLIGRLS